MKPAQQPRRGPRLRRAGVLLIAVLAAAGVSACGRTAGDQTPEDPPPIAPEPLSPRGAGPVPSAFAWKLVPGDRVYRVIVTDAAERMLYQQDIRNGSSIPFPSELKAMMSDERAAFLWSVAIVTPDGRHLARSPSLQFSLK